MCVCVPWPWPLAGLAAVVGKLLLRIPRIPRIPENTREYPENPLLCVQALPAVRTSTSHHTRALLVARLVRSPRRQPELRAAPCPRAPYPRDGTAAKSTSDPRGGGEDGPDSKPAHGGPTSNYFDDWTQSKRDDLNLPPEPPPPSN